MIPFVVPLDDTDGVGPGKPNCWDVVEVGDIERRPEPPALNEKARTGPTALPV